ncbi:hypothetical protein FOZ63_033983, partial [Perkinsus olseni]
LSDLPLICSYVSEINLSYIWVLCSLDYMVENSLADSAENLPPAVVKVCALLGVKDSTLLRFLPDAEIDKYCSKFVGDGAVSLKETLSFRSYVASLRSALAEAATTSSDIGAVSFASGDDHAADEVPTMSRMLQIVKSIQLPNDRYYEGYQDDRSVTWFVSELSNEARLYQLDRMSGLGVDYLRSTYSASDDPSFLEDRISSLRQKGDENVFHYLDRGE